MDQEEVKLNLRLAPELHKQLTAEAKRFERSLQREIVWRLRQSLEQPSATARVVRR
jgi:predicted HicB family RNase H-like nuclease